MKEFLNLLPRNIVEKLGGKKQNRSAAWQLLPPEVKKKLSGANKV